MKQQPVEPNVIAGLMAALSTPDLAESPASFPRDPAAAAQPGLYAWWADAEATQVLSTVLDAPLPPLIYAGQAGATTWPSGKRGRATLRSRLRSNHIGGNIRASTFRHTLAAVTRHAIALDVIGPSRLTPESEERLSIWIREHCCVVVEPIADPDRLESIEHAVLMALDPPLNLRGMAPSPVRTRLQALRRDLSRGA